MDKLKNKTALITGSSRGIGKVIAKLFVMEGAEVILHGRDREALIRAQAEIEREGRHTVFFKADVTKFLEIEEMRKNIEEEFGPVEILVVNAGGSFTKPAPLEQIPEDGWHASVEGNLTATYLTLKSFLPPMKERRRGNIITISSSAGRRSNPKSPIPYAAAKAGIQILTQHLASQVGEYNIRVNCIAPETILTERNMEWIPKDLQESLISWHPIKRLGTPEDIAQAALFLASENSSWITGTILDISGGAVMV